MKITIQGQDYTAALDAAHALTIERKLNAPSICQLWLSLPAGGSLAAPSRFNRLIVTGDDGTIYFTGYVAASPLPEYAGFGLEGPRYRTAIEAVSDELLLDKLPMPVGSLVSRTTSSALISSLVAHSGSQALATQGLTLNTVVANFAAEKGANWSQAAGQAAGMARAAYRTLNGALSLVAMQSTVHPLNESDGSLNLANLTFTSSTKRALANDVTVCGEEEPVAYVTEYFLGDGVTTQFYLSTTPYIQSGAKATIIRELFNEAQIDATRWGVPTGGNRMSIGAAGLAVSGGNGIDGQTLLSWIDPIEMGGTLLLEAIGVTLAAGSTGILAGFYGALGAVADCVAGFQATAAQGTGAVTLQPIVGGVAVGSTIAVNAANQYTLRVRVHCAECQRARSAYYSYGDSGPIAAGGDWLTASGKIQMEIQEFVNGVGATPVTLYDGAVANLPGVCMVVPVSSISLAGAVRTVNLTNLGSGWVVSTPAGGSAYTRRLGSAAEAGECHVERSGKLVFYTGSTPAAGEQIAVSYRSEGRAVGRAVNTISQQALAAADLPAVAVWIGSVTQPAARSSADCRNAAQVMAQAAASPSALWSGSYKGASVSFATDVWPGDALLLNAPSANLNAQVVVRAVRLSYRASVPDLVEYAIAFANDWADDLAIKTSATVPANAWLPATANPTVLANLTSLTVTALSGSTVTVNTGVAPPTGGGFEIRRRDFAFMAGEDPDLVLRGSEQNLIFARQSASDRFYIRMYDGATPPNYSEFSTALLINLPLSS